MAVDPQTRATQELTREVTKLGKVLEMINMNIIAVANALNDNPIETVQSKPATRLPHYITPPGADPYGTQR